MTICQAYIFVGWHLGCTQLRSSSALAGFTQAHSVSFQIGCGRMVQQGHPWMLGPAPLGLSSSSRVALACLSAAGWVLRKHGYTHGYLRSRVHMAYHHFSLTWAKTSHKTSPTFKGRGRRLSFLMLGFQSHIAKGMNTGRQKWLWTFLQSMYPKEWRMDKQLGTTRIQNTSLDRLLRSEMT